MDHTQKIVSDFDYNPTQMVSDTHSVHHSDD